MRRSNKYAFARGAVLLFVGLEVSVASAQIAFTDVTEAAGMTHSSESYGASWGDLNGDGLLDLYTSNHRTQDSLFLNKGNGSFVDIANQIQDWVHRPNADTHGGTWADFDNDGDQDLMISTGGGPSEVLVNENQQLVDRTLQLGLAISNLDARMPVWMDYDNDHLLDVIIAQYGGGARLFHQNPGGGFTDTTAAAGLDCVHLQYAQLLDVNGDGRLDFLCPAHNRFPDSIYDPTTFPWTTLSNAAHPAAFLPTIGNVVDSAVADFNNDGHMDVFVLGGGQLRPSSVVQVGSNTLEALLSGGSKGLQFVSAGPVTLSVDWNNAGEGGSTDLTKIQIGHAAHHPTAPTFTLDPADPSVAGMPPDPKSASALPAMQIGYDPATHLWTLRIVAKLTRESSGAFSQAYIRAQSTATITGLVATGLWPTDNAAPPTLLMNQNGTFIDGTVAAGLGAPVECASVTAGDFDNDMYVDLYLACRTGASNIANILYHNNHDGTFTMVPDAGGAAGPIGLAIANDAGAADSVVNGDYDVDGFLDLFVTNGFNMLPMYVGGPNKLYHNNGNANHWIELDLIGVNSDRDATGAMVYANANGVSQLRVQDGRYHRWSQDAKRIHFGLAAEQAVSLTVKWPSGATQTFADVAANHLYQITEGHPDPVPVALPSAPTSPIELMATAGDGSVKLVWTAATGATSYNVYQGTAAGHEGTTPVLTAITGTTADVASLTNGTTYYFVVKADTATGVSGPSNEVSVTPVAPSSGSAGNSGGTGNSGAASSSGGGSNNGGGGGIDPWSLIGIAFLGTLRRRKRPTIKLKEGRRSCENQSLP